MILVGQDHSPFVRRVAVSLRLLEIAYEHDTRSVFGDFDAIRRINPTGRIPSLILDDGETLIDSGTILDHLDETVGPSRRLMPADGERRRRAMRLTALACGATEKIGAATYERLVRPSAYRWPDWIERCEVQGTGAIAALAAESWAEPTLDQPQITTACMIFYVRMTNPHLMPAGRYPSLDVLAERCEARPEFAATRPAEYAVPRG